MKRLVIAISTLVIFAGQTTLASAATKDLPGVTKISANACALPAKSTKLAKAPRVENRCDTDVHGRQFDVGVVPLVFGGAAIAGIVAVAVSTTNNNSPTSP